MENPVVFAVIDDGAPPVKLMPIQSSDSSSPKAYRCRIASLPDHIVVYGRGDALKLVGTQRLRVVLQLDHRMRDKVVGEFGGATGATALAQRIEWTAEERAVGARMDSEQRLAKVLVRVVSGDTPPPHDRVDDVVSAMQPMLYATPKTSSAVDTDQADNDNDDDTQTSHDAAPRRKRRAPSGSPNAKRRRPPVSAEDIRAFDFGDDVECGSPAKNKDGSARTTTGLDASPSIGVVASATPSGRWGHTMTAVDDSGSNFVVFGGQGDGDDMVRDRLWRLQGSVWHDEPSPLGQVPMGRMGHTTVLDVDAARLVVFGGSKNMRWFNDVHAYSLASREWTQVKYTGKAPTSSYHSATVFRGEMYVFGGVHGHASVNIPDECSAAVHIFDFVRESWYQPIVSGDAPCPRSGHSATLFDDTLVIFGGWDTPTAFNDLFTLDLTLMEFTRVETTSGNAPSPRSWHSAVALPGRRLLVTGGFDGEAALADSHIFDLDKQSWTEVVPSVLDGRVTAGHTMSYADGNVIVFGGGDNDGHHYDSLSHIALSALSL